MKLPALRPEDGATFNGRVEPTGETGKHAFRAECRAVVEVPEPKVEEPTTAYFGERQAGIDWIEKQARNRGFEKWYDESAKAS